MENEKETQALLIKVTIYVGATMLGLIAKLAHINHIQKLTIREALFHSAVAFACSWVVFFIMKYYNCNEYFILSVLPICGRFADSIMIAIFKAFKKGILTMFNGLK